MFILRPGWIPQDTSGLSHAANMPSAEFGVGSGVHTEHREDPTWTYEHDLTAEDFIVHFLGRDRGSVRVDRKADSDADHSMSPLEKEASTLIFDGADSSRLRVIVGLLNLQAKRKLSDVTMTDIFTAIDDLIIPKNANSRMPRSRADERKLVSEVGLDYNVIHACPCDKTLYYGKNESLSSCPECQRSRFKENTVRTNVPRKVSLHIFFYCNIFISFFETRKELTLNCKEPDPPGQRRSPEAPARADIERGYCNISICFIYRKCFIFLLPQG